ncbi:AsmA family protein [Limnoglobus roseus]|uniref:Uncharacterized protein n=1 Tax=Limnoglobus roseus TaxID=2598579 RepID=A0A5C1ANN6_9BACT|nr:hypothetical protein [Limnoglobus roseus]QEL20851.1 hypothetical protein PX52LOC_07971 [Limnoglobus roseus]
MKRLRKVFLWVLGITGGLMVVAWFGLKAYINSSYARQTAATQISDIVGLPVLVESLSVGTGSTTASLRITDTASETPAELLKIGALETDISLMDLVSGRVAPTAVTVKDVEFLLRIDADGKILSPLPKAKAGGPGETKTIPTVQLVNGRVRIQQTGHPEFDLTRVNAKLQRDGDAYALTGDADDPKWGKWTITGRITTEPAGGQFQLHTDQATAKIDLLKSIPYVPMNVWDEIVPEGPTAATVTLGYQTAGGFGYGVDLKPLRASLTIPEVSATLTDLEGHITIGGDKVTIQKAHGTLASGTLTAEGVYDFAKPTGVFKSKVTAQGVAVEQLPEVWGLKRRKITGKLRGDADLELHFPPAGHVDTRGNGRGDIEGAKIAGIPVTIKLKMTGGNGRYEFESDQPADPK